MTKPQKVRMYVTEAEAKLIGLLRSMDTEPIMVGHDIARAQIERAKGETDLELAQKMLDRAEMAIDAFGLSGYGPEIEALRADEWDAVDARGNRCWSIYARSAQDARTLIEAALVKGMKPSSLFNERTAAEHNATKDRLLQRWNDGGRTVIKTKIREAAIQAEGQKVIAELFSKGGAH